MTGSSTCCRCWRSSGWPTLLPTSPGVSGDGGKLAPAISPGKTWAGVGGAVAAVLSAAFLFSRFAPDVPAFSTLLQQRLALVAAMAVLAALVALSIIGDLFESLLKRQVDAKDSGRLLPGHGGVLDRIDALIAVLPAAALLDLWLRR